MRTRAARRLPRGSSLDSRRRLRARRRARSSASVAPLHQRAHLVRAARGSGRAPRRRRSRGRSSRAGPRPPGCAGSPGRPSSRLSDLRPLWPARPPPRRASIRPNGRSISSCTPPRGRAARRARRARGRRRCRSRSCSVCGSSTPTRGPPGPGAAVRVEAARTSLRLRQPPALGGQRGHLEADVVAGARVAVARVPEPDDQPVDPAAAVASPAPKQAQGSARTPRPPRRRRPRPRRPRPRRPRPRPRSARRPRRPARSPPRSPRAPRPRSGRRPWR